MCIFYVFTMDCWSSGYDCRLPSYRLAAESGSIPGQFISDFWHLSDAFVSGMGFLFVFEVRLGRGARKEHLGAPGPDALFCKQRHVISGVKRSIVSRAMLFHLLHF
jgi:hypothetical protein